MGLRFFVEIRPKFLTCEWSASCYVHVNPLKEFFVRVKQNAVWAQRLCERSGEQTTLRPHLNNIF
jgi:hypothetical protein